MPLIKGERIVDDHWRVIDDPETPLAELPAGEAIVPLALWLREREALLDRTAASGVWLDAHEEAERLADDVDRLALIAIHFPIFWDGRGLSNAVLLRTRLGFRGELRAIGDVQRDILSYMRRCGFDAFAVRSDRDIGQALAGLHVMSRYYQGSAIEPEPLFRRMQR